MRTTITIDGVELSVFTVDVIYVSTDNSYPSSYTKAKDEKWIKFCKDHKFHPTYDAYGKIYNLYLEMCAEGLL